LISFVAAAGVALDLARDGVFDDAIAGKVERDPGCSHGVCVNR
jgi:hypothetical protein